jgi:dephospho-CoA kinase
MREPTPGGRPLHIGLTGNIASGKSTVARLLTARGATVIDADALAREVVAPGTPGFDEVVAHFGASVLSPAGDLDRARLRALVFSDAIARTALNAIVHPAVGRLRDTRLREATARGDAIVVSDIPLLFEVGLEHAFDAILLVDAPMDTRRARLVRDRHLTDADADAMIAAQWPSERKRAGATWVIDNDGTPAQLEECVADVWRRISELAASRRHAASSP